MKNQTAQKQFPWPLLWLILLCLIPFIFAPLLHLFKDKVPIKIKHTGQLFTPPIAIETLPFLYSKIKQEKEGESAEAEKWRLVYLCSAKDSKVCLANQDLLQRMYAALGKESIRVSLIYPNLKTNEMLQSPETNKTHKSNDKLPHKLPMDNQVLLIDPRGFLILYYPLPLQNPKGMLEDIRRLLRYSHVG